MFKQKPTGIYRSILLEALELTWKRKSLWVFGLFAGVISTGGVMDIAINSFHQLYVLGATRVTSIFALCIFVLIGVLVAGVLSQTALILNSKSVTEKHPHHLRKEALEHFWSVFVLDVLTKLSTAILISIASLPFILWMTSTTPQVFWIVFAHTLFFLPLIIILNILSILAIIDVVDHNTKPLDAIATALRLFRSHWIATFEFGLILFFLVLVSGVGLVVISGLLLVPYAIIYTSALFTGSITLFFASNIIFGIMLFTLILVFAGAIVTFQYTAWHRFYQRAIHKRLGSKAFSKILRALHIS